MFRNKRAATTSSSHLDRAWQAQLDANPGLWFRCPAEVAVMYFPFSGSMFGGGNTLLDPSMYQLYRDGGPQGPLYARRRPRPDRLFSAYGGIEETA